MKLKVCGAQQQVYKLAHLFQEGVGKSLYTKFEWPKFG